MRFTIQEVNGEEPVTEWLIMKIKEYARVTYGLNVTIEIAQPYIKSSFQTEPTAEK